LKVLLATEVYPPRAGGAGWSTRALALGLRAAGHDVAVVTTSPGPPTLDGVAVERLAVSGRKRVHAPRAFAAALSRRSWDVVHAQHGLSALGCLGAESAPPVVVTVRDYWPTCFWSTRISRGALCPACGVRPMMRCVSGRVPLPAPLSWAVLPYMRHDLREKREALRRAGAVLAVSEAVAGELRRDTGCAVVVVPNVVDGEEARTVARGEPSLPLPAEFLLFVGKLEDNKGLSMLLPAVAAARTGLPLVVLGDGAWGAALGREASARGVPLLTPGWAKREDVLRALARATVVVFPSLWPEPLSRVLLEALAVGAPVAAIDTGGTAEILTDDVSGLLVRDAPELGRAIARLAGEPALRARIQEGARSRSAAFSPEALIPRYEAVYRRLS